VFLLGIASFKEVGPKRKNETLRIFEIEGASMLTRFCATNYKAREHTNPTVAKLPDDS
jgi:hypothetical protein